LVDCTIDFGPLNFVNCFQFEEVNRKLIRLLFGHDLIGEEIISKYETAQSLSLFSNTIENHALKSFVQSGVLVKTSNRKKLSTQFANHIVINSSGQSTSDNNYLTAYERATKIKPTNLIIYKKITFNGINYDSHLLESKKSNSCIATSTNKIGLIECFYCEHDKLYAVCRTIVNIYNPFFSQTCPSIKSHMSICYISDEYFVEEITSSTNKMFTIKVSTKENTECFVSSFSTRHLFN
jgi:hypothetical protein